MSLLHSPIVNFPFSPVANGENGLNRALYGTSVKFGTLIERIKPIVLRNRAFSNLACGCRGNQFNVLYISSNMAITQAADIPAGFRYTPLERAHKSLLYGILIYFQRFNGMYNYLLRKYV